MKCYFCNQDFPSRYLRNMHMKRDHRGEIDRKVTEMLDIGKRPGEIAEELGFSQKSIRGMVKKRVSAEAIYYSTRLCSMIQEKASQDGWVAHLVGYISGMVGPEGIKDLAEAMERK